MKYIPQSDEDQRELLSAIGLKNTNELFSYIPESVRITRPLNYPLAQSEIEIRKTFEDISKLSPRPSVSFAGCGVYEHYIPSIVPQIQGRSEFATAYTPYQAEISQGLLQAIFEFQTLVCQLTETELSNASVYDGATALAEGVLMALRLKKKATGKIFIADNIHPFYREVVRSYCTMFEDRIETLASDGDKISLSALEAALKNSADIIVTQSPNVFGVIEDYSAISKKVKNSDAIWVTSTMEPFSWGILRGPGAFGAHIVTAEGQSFGNGPYLGGSSFGLFSTRDEYIRQLPGRLVGETVDQKGRRSYVLTFATREQFIRREKATSNICTNQNLNMLAGLIHLTTLGKQGVRDIAVQNLSRTEYVKKELKSQGHRISSSPTFNEFVVEANKPAKDLINAAAGEGWVPGVDLGVFRSEWKNKLLVHLNELHDSNQMNRLVQFMRSYV